MTIRQTLRFGLFGLGLSTLAACTTEHDGCAVRDGIQPICGLAAPEDIVVAPDEQFLIFGQMGGPGGLYQLDTSTSKPRRLSIDTSAGEHWGAQDCAEPPPADLQAHGIDLLQRRDGRWQLLVVNHQARESVEFFELLRGDEGYALAWRGCAIPPPEGNLNDVAGLPEGGFLVTHMADKGSEVSSLVKSLRGENTGYVYHWSREAGYRPLEQTWVNFPNGIIMSPDGESFFLNAYFGNAVHHFSWPSLERLGSTPVEKPDNNSWTRDGKLLVASQHAATLPLILSLGHGVETPALLPFSIVEIDPKTHQRTNTPVQREGLPMGAGTVGVLHDTGLYVGSYVGDRMIRISLAQLARP